MNHSRIADRSPKMRSKVGVIVSRSSRVSLTSKTIRGSSATLIPSLMDVHFSPCSSGACDESWRIEPDKRIGHLGQIGSDDVRLWNPGQHQWCYTVAREQRCQASSAFGSDKIPDVGRDQADRGSRYIQLLRDHLIRRSRWHVLPHAVSSELSFE